MDTNTEGRHTNDTNTEKELKLLVRKRGAVKRTFTWFTMFFDKIEMSFNNGISIGEQTVFDLKERTEKLESLIHDFENIQLEIEQICDDTNLDNQYKERVDFLELHAQYLSRSKFIISKLLPDDANSGKSIPTQVSVSPTSQPNPINFQLPNESIRLPPISLPTFNGDFQKWIEFKDTFNSLINKNTTLSDIQRFHYLRSSLGDNVSNIIDNLEFSESNYAVAWKMLCERYDNKHMLVSSHLKALFNLKYVQSDSAKALRELIDSVRKHLHALKSLQLPSDHDLSHALLVFLVSERLDKISLTEWEKHNVKGNLPTIYDFLTFLENKADFLETMEAKTQNITRSFQIKGNKKPKHRYSLLSGEISNQQKQACYFCGENHLIYHCFKFLKLNVSQRWDKIKELKLCSNCLCKGHFNKDCSYNTCKHCQNKHNSLLHHQVKPEVPPQEFSQNPPQTDKAKVLVSTESNKNECLQGNNASLQTQNYDNKNKIHVKFSSVISENYVMLSTAIVYIADANGQLHKARAVLDSGSQSCFVSNELCNRLNLKQSKTNISIMGINNNNSNLKSKCTISFGSLYNDSSYNVTCYVLPQISDNLPLYNIDVSLLNIPTNIVLADPEFYISSPVDMLIGSNLFWDILSEGKIVLGKNLPVLQNTTLGYIVAGNLSFSVSNVQCLFSRTDTLHNDIKKFWEIEEICSSDLKSNEYEFCEEHFLNTVSRDISGKFVVRIPLKGSPQDLGDSKLLATKRLLNMESRFKKDSQLKENYVLFMQEYLDLGHMSLDENYNQSVPAYFLPHHGVMREDSMTTKLRVVFDGSAVTTSGKSLNSIQHTGPPIQNDIFQILLKFRFHEFAVVSDIEKMYRCILVHPDDRYLQKIVWRKDSNDPLSVMTLNTVTYGTASAPYLAMRCLKQVGLDVRESFPVASEIIQNDFYVDDLITAFDDVQVAKKTCQEISQVLSSAGFKLRKWVSNNPKILDKFDDSSDSLNVLHLGGYDSVKTLGVQWFPKLDVLGYNISIKNNSKVTKRGILSEIAKIYDPLGLLSASTILVKILIQKLWFLKFDWDEILPSEISNEWLKFKSELSLFNNLKIPRFVSTKFSFKCELHGFSDASQSAYSAAVYLRCINHDDSVSINLVCAKTKVAPLKILTIPRLELCGVLLLARLMQIVSRSFNISHELFYWCDSQIVLHWINSESSSLQVFVGNRVSEIQRLSDIKKWYYVQSKHNPADVASRGVMPSDVLEHKLWWFGPEFLYDRNFIPVKFEKSSSINLPEQKGNCFALVAVKKVTYDLFQKFSSFKRLIHVHAYCLRFIFNLRNFHKDKKSGSLSVSELEKSILSLVKLAQTESFSEEISIIKSKNELKSNHRLQALAPFLDSDGLLRVGGRLKHSLLNYNKKHPLLLDGKHKFSRLIVEYEHKQLLHAGPQLLLSSVRQKYWPTSGISLAKSVVRSCVRCFKFKPKSHSVFMADLPEPRVSVSQPFTHTGVDYAGPFILKDRKGRGCKTFKAYICLFICFSTKAIHLELVTDLTTEAFIASFRRFVCRRGKPSHLYSDNATNFVGAHKELKLLYEFLQQCNDQIFQVLAEENTEWHFIPPNSPTFGGLWESNIKGVKYHLSRVLFNTLLTYEEFVTVLVQIEAILNSRPLYPMSSDPNDFEPLTPSHFLIGRSYTSVPDPHFKDDVRVNQLSRFQLLQQLQKSFWKHWSQSYLSHLQSRSKWRNKTVNLPIGKLVLIRNENLPPCKWLLGRVVEIHPGLDNVVRVVTLKTNKGLLKRSVTKLCPLPDIEEVH